MLEAADAQNRDAMLVQRAAEKHRLGLDALNHVLSEGFKNSVSSTEIVWTFQQLEVQF